MKIYPLAQQGTRRGAVAILTSVLIVFLLIMVAFSVDMGYIVVVRMQLQNAADSACMAGASQLLDPTLLMGMPDQTSAMANAATEAKKFSQSNYGGGVALTLLDNPSNSPSGDIVCGYLSDPSDLNQQFDYSRYPNSVQVRVRRDPTANGSLSLFFARIMGITNQDVTATATASFRDRIVGFQISTPGYPTCKLLPFALHIDTWNLLLDGTLQGELGESDGFTRNDETRTVAAGADGIHECKLYPLSNNSGGHDLPPGNFGTVDIGSANNSTADLARQILYGPNASDLSYYPDGILQLDPETGTLLLNGDTGVSAGVKDELIAIKGQARIIPLYQSVSGPGNNAEYVIVGFAGITITEVVLTGSLASKHLTIQPCFAIDPNANPGTTVSNPSWFAYTPVSLTR